MKESEFLNLAHKINDLVSSYQSGAVKHFQYVSQYDKLLEQYGITKKQLLAEVEKRSGHNYSPENETVSVAKVIRAKKQ